MISLIEILYIMKKNCSDEEYTGTYPTIHTKSFSPCIVRKMAPYKDKATFPSLHRNTRKATGIGWNLSRGR